MKLALTAMSRWVGRQFRFTGFSWSTNQRVFVFVLASALMLVFAGNIGLKLVSAAALSVSCGLAGVPLAECVAAIPRFLRERRLVSAAKPARSPVLLEQYDNLAATMHVRVKGRCPLKIAPAWANAGATIRR